MMTFLYNISILLEVWLYYFVMAAGLRLWYSHVSYITVIGINCSVGWDTISNIAAIRSLSNLLEKRSQRAHTRWRLKVRLEMQRKWLLKGLAWKLLVCSAARKLISKCLQKVIVFHSIIIISIPEIPKWVD